jgi:ferredoxin
MQTGQLFDLHQQAMKQAGWKENIRPQVFVTDAPLEEYVATEDEIQRELDDSISLENPLLQHVQLVGSVPLEQLSQWDQVNLRTLLPEAESLVVFGVEMPSRVVELAGKQSADCGVSYAYCSYQMQKEALWAASDLAFAFQRKGNRAMALLYPDPSVEGVFSPYAYRVTDSRVAARFAEAAGLGFIGKGGFLISKEYGPRLRFAFMLTDRKLPANPRVIGACPEGCRACADACPINALNPNGGEMFDFDNAKCRWAGELGMVKGEGAHLGGQWKNPNLPVPEVLDEQTIQQAYAQKDPIQTICYQNPRQGETSIERCIQACPFVSDSCHE